MDAVLQKLGATFSSDGQVKWLALHEKYRFDHNDVEAFKINTNGKLLESNLAEFETHLEEEALKKKKKDVAKNQKHATATAKKRKFEQSFGLRDMMSVAKNYDITPERKRSHKPVLEATAASEVASTESVMTPDPSPRTAAVTLKTSINEKLHRLSPQERVAPDITVLGDTSWYTHKDGQQPYSWMDDAVESRSNACDARLQSFEKAIIESLCQKFGEDVQEGQVGANSQAQVALCGRILCEYEGKLNEQSLVLEGSRQSCRGARVRLVTSECSEVAAFPGQIVGVVGRTSPSGKQFHASHFAPGLPVSAAAASRTTSTPLHVIVAAGPFSRRDDLDFAPLEALCQHAIETQPQALVLLGPLVDVNNLRVQEGDCCAPHSDDTRGLDEVYANHVVPLLSRLCHELRQKSPNTKVMLVPSLDEALVFHPLPQPPMDLSMCLDGNPLASLQRLGVCFLPNPAYIKVNGVSIAASSTDALSPLLRDLVLRSNGKRIEEAQRLLLLQRTLFPVFPRSHSVSESHADALSFPSGTTPDVCIFPSAIGPGSGTFVDDCLFLNPGPLCRATLGTFAEVTVHEGASALHERARVDIQKIC